MNDIVSKAKSLNEEVSRLNNERIRQEGMLESARNSYENAIKAYAEKYGVVLDENTIQSEYNKVFATVKGAILDLTEKIESIQRGDYKKNVESVEFDMEPNVTPIREEKKKETVKRGRKPKVKKEDVANAVDETANEVKKEDGVADVKDDSVMDGPFKFDMNTDAFSNNTFNMSDSSMDKPKEDNPVGVKNKVLSPSALSEAIKATAQADQHPVTAISEEDIDESDVVSSAASSVNTTLNPFEPNVSKENELQGFSFGSFGDINSFGVETVPTVENTPDNKGVTSDDEVDLSNFKFGGFGDISVPSGESEVKPKQPDFAGFGGFGGLSDSAFIEPKTIPEKSKEPEQADAPVGWGDFGAVDFDAILNNSNGVKI